MASAEERLATLEAGQKTILGQLANYGKLLDELHTMNTSLAVQGKAIEQIAKTVEDHGEHIEGLENTPRKRWDAIVGALIAALVGGGLGAVLSKLF